MEIMGGYTRGMTAPKLHIFKIMCQGKVGYKHSIYGTKSGNHTLGILSPLKKLYFHILDFHVL
jgi:hypothetical protein